MKELFQGIFLIDKKIATENIVPGYKPFSEELVKIKNKEYRIWYPRRSKPAAAVLKNIKDFPIKKNSIILYLGAAHGYTCSYLACIVGEKGIIYAVEFSERCFNKFLPLCKKYKNIVPILADARMPEKYGFIEKVDVVYIDVAQPDEVKIFIRNCKEFLKPDGYGMIAIKSRSIDVTKSPKQIYKESLEKLKKAGFKIIDWKTLDPYERAHAFIVVKF